MDRRLEQAINSKIKMKIAKSYRKTCHNIFIISKMNIETTRIYHYIFNNNKNLKVWKNQDLVRTLGNENSFTHWWYADWQISKKMGLRLPGKVQDTLSYITAILLLDTKPTDTCTSTGVYISKVHVQGYS